MSWQPPQCLETIQAKGYSTVVNILKSSCYYSDHKLQVCLSVGEQEPYQSSLYLTTKSVTVYKQLQTLCDGRKEKFTVVNEKVQATGGLIIKHKVDSLGELRNYDIIINCTGLAAKNCCVVISPMKAKL